MLHHVVEPVLDPSEVVTSVEVRFREWDVVDKVLEDWLLLIDRLCLAAVVVHVTFVLGESRDALMRILLIIIQGRLTFQAQQ